MKLQVLVVFFISLILHVFLFLGLIGGVLEILTCTCQLAIFLWPSVNEILVKVSELLVGRLKIIRKMKICKYEVTDSIYSGMTLMLFPTERTGSGTVYKFVINLVWC